MRRRDLLLSALALALAAPSAAADDTPAGSDAAAPGPASEPSVSASPAPPLPPRLVIEPATRTPRQGGVVPLAIKPDRPLVSLVLAQRRQNVPVDLFADGALARALVGIDLDAPVGDLPFQLDAVARDGSTATVTYTLQVLSGDFRVQRLRVAEKYVELPPSVLERVKRDQAAVARVFATGDPTRRWTGPFLRPVDEPPADNFGVRRVFNDQPRAPHNGVDFGAPEGTPVAAPAAGRTAMASDLYFSGQTVIVDHGAGLFTLYFHLSRLDVAEGDLVEPGQPLGAVGATGRSTGPHLHWGARLHRARVNPLGLLSLPDWR